MKMPDIHRITRIEDFIQRQLQQAIPHPREYGLTTASLRHIQLRITQKAELDLRALVTKDAAALHEKYVLEAYRSFKAILSYRIAHTFVQLADNSNNLDLITKARRLSEDTTLLTGIEIHPAASIGHSFVIDHGLHTLIGETADIGDHCYFLNGVTIGARKISHSASLKGRRHAKIGNHVEIAGHVRILGPVTIGDHVKIQAFAKIEEDIPSHSTVKVLSSIQVCSHQTHSVNVNGVVKNPDGSISIYGTGLRHARIELHRPGSEGEVNIQYVDAQIPIELIATNDYSLTFKVLNPKTPIEKYCIGLAQNSHSATTPTSYLFTIKEGDTVYV